MKFKTRTIEKPWGSKSLPAIFDHIKGDQIGEIWFEAPVHSEQSSQPLMIKYLFTSEKLSIQVHPCNEDALARNMPCGKDECWYILDAEPDATLGIGLKESISKDHLREAALSGEIEQLMDWKPVKKGDFFYIPAGTIHAIGPGVTLIEVQQNIDLTYRLYDYGRPRELHLDDAVAVANPAPYSMDFFQKTPTSGYCSLVDGPYFNLVRVDGNIAELLKGLSKKPYYVVPLSGAVTSVNYELSVGECCQCNSLEDLQFSDDAQLLLASAV